MGICSTIYYTRCEIRVRNHDLLHSMRDQG
jgi:hypothetical protein